ncbi:hypothetical protein J7K25_07045, partial [bacterium]|nr:hypothetical protein [bacterium]
DETGKTVYIGVFDNQNMEGEPVATGMIEDFESGDAYTVSGLANGRYYVGAYMDINNNEELDPIDPFGKYGEPTAIEINNSDVTGKDITLTKPIYDKYRGYGIGTGPGAEILKDNLYLFADGTFFLDSDEETETGTWNEDDKGFITFTPSDEEEHITGYKKSGIILLNESEETESISSELEIFILDDGTTFSDEDINNTSWNVINILSGDDNGWERGTMTIDENGNYTYSYEDCEGEEDNDEGGPITIDEEGVIYLENEPVGFMAGNKKVAVLSGQENTGEGTTYWLMIMSKQGTGFDETKLPGTYTVFEITTSDDNEVTESKKITFEIDENLNLEALEKNWQNKLLYTRGKFEFEEEDSIFTKTENPYEFIGAGVVLDGNTSLIGYTRLNPIGGCAVGIGLSGPDYTDDKSAISTFYNNFVTDFNAENDLTGYFAENFLHAGKDRNEMINWLTGEEAPDEITSITDIHTLIIQDRALTRFKVEYEKDGEQFTYNVALDDMNYLIDIPEGSWYLSGNGFNSRVIAASGTENGEYSIDFHVEAEGDLKIQQAETVIVKGPGLPAEGYPLWVSGNGDSAYGDFELDQTPPKVGSVYTFYIHYDNDTWETIQDSIENVMDGVALSNLSPFETITDPTPQFSFTLAGTANEPFASSYAIDISKDIGEGEEWIGTFENGTLEGDKTYTVDYDNLTDVAEGYETGLHVDENYILEAEVFDIFGNYASAVSEFNLENPVLTVNSDHGTPECTEDLEGKTQGTGDYTYNYGTEVTASVDSPVDGGEGTQYLCTGWEGAGDVPETGTETTTTFTITQDSSITWLWITQYYLTVNNGGHGTPIGEGWYDEGVTATFSIDDIVEGEEGTRYKFAGWTGDYTGMDNPGTILMDSPKEVTATWTTQYQLTINIEGQGTVTPTTGNWYDDGTPVDLTATPADGWLFDHWEGDVADPNSASTTVTMNSDKTITAVFVRNAPELSVNPTDIEFSFNIGNLEEPTQKDTQITIENIGASGILEWHVGEINYQEGEGWIQVFVPANGIGGELNPGEQKIIGIQVDRTELSAGIYHATVPIESNAGTENINITMRIDTPPEAAIISPNENTFIPNEKFINLIAQFTDPDEGDEISNTEWILYDETLNETVLTYPLNDNTKVETTLSIPWATVKPGHTYHWKVRCQDKFGKLWSEWAVSNSWNVLQDNVYNQQHNVPEKNEILNAFNSLVDTEVCDVFKEAVNGETIVVGATGILSQNPNLQMRSMDPAEIKGSEAFNIEYLFDIRIDGITAGDTVVVSVYLPGNYTGNWYKYNPVDETWTIYPNAEIVGTVTIDGQTYTRIDLTLTDGGDGDFDGEANGVIVDPSGFGPITGVSSVSGGGGGCFIATAAYGSYQEKHVWILRQFRDKYLLTNRPGKAFVRWYYRHSPKYASIIAQHPVLRNITRILLTPLYVLAYIVVKNLALPLLLFLLGLGSAIVLRRKIKTGKIFLLIFASLFLLFSTSSFAADTNLFKIAPGEKYTVVSPSSETTGKGKLKVDFFYSYADNPVEGKIGGVNKDLISDQSLIQIGATYGLTDK